MRQKSRKSVATLLMMVTLVTFTLMNLKVCSSYALGASIDLFTQKKPYSGRGPDMPSDAFGPGEVVFLNALAAFNEMPVQNLLVVFRLTTPKATSFNLASTTGPDGIATVNFTIPTPSVGLNESEVFGTWEALASTMIGANQVQDTLTFNVNWIVQIISIKTIDGNLTCRTIFGLGGDVGFEIVLKSASMTLKNATIAITIQDELGVPVNFSEINNFEVQPNEKSVFLYAKIQIPTDAPTPFIGNATATIMVLTAPANMGGIAFSPSKSTKFFISPFDPIKIALHDVAVVNITCSAASIQPGESLDVEVVVTNEGTEVETFNVTAYLGTVLIGTINVYSLRPYSGAIAAFAINTKFGAGEYTLAASIPPLVNENEADLTDNTLVYGTVEIRLKTSIFIHNIAITSVEISNNSLDIGDVLQISVVAFNKGNETETFSVTAYYNSSPIGTLVINTLKPTTEASVTFLWNTSSVCEGVYLITAIAPLPNDIDTSDNTYVDGFVTITKPLPGSSPSFCIGRLLPWLMLLLLILIVLLIFLLYRKAKRDGKRKHARAPSAYALPSCFEDTAISNAVMRAPSAHGRHNREI